MEDRACEHDAVEERDRDTDRRPRARHLEHPVGGRAVQVEVVPAADVDRREDHRPLGFGEAHVADERFVEDGIDDRTVVGAALALTAEGGAGHRGAARRHGTSIAADGTRWREPDRRGQLPAAPRGGGDPAPRPGHHVGEGERVEMGPHVLADVGPDREQDTLPLVVAGPVLVRQPEVAGDDRAVDGGHDLGEGDLRRGAREHVATADAALGADEPGTLQREEDLLEVGLGKPGALGDVPHRGRAFAVRVQRERQQRPARIVTSGGDLHSGHAIAWSCARRLSTVERETPSTRAQRLSGRPACRRRGPRPSPTRR